MRGVGQQGGVSTATEPGETIDRVIAIVNGDLILESDVDEERRFAAFQPLTQPAGAFTREQAIERLIRRTLILQQAKLQQGTPIKAIDVETQIATPAEGHSRLQAIPVRDRGGMEQISRSSGIHSG